MCTMCVCVCVTRVCTQKYMYMCACLQLAEGRQAPPRWRWGTAVSPPVNNLMKRKGKAKRGSGLMEGLQAGMWTQLPVRRRHWCPWGQRPRSSCQSRGWWERIHWLPHLLPARPPARARAVPRGVLRPSGCSQDHRDLEPGPVPGARGTETLRWGARISTRCAAGANRFPAQSWSF